MKNVLTLLTSFQKNRPKTVGNKTVKNCPFCQKEELFKTNKVLEDNSFLWIENRYPYLKGTYQTVIIESDSCENDFTNYSIEYAHALLEFCMNKREEWKNSKLFRDVLLLKNHGVQSDSSIHHAHMQLVGLYDSEYNSKGFESSVKGPVVFENEGVCVTVSAIPQAEFYEFNVKWSKEEKTSLYVEWIQHLIRFVFYFQNGKYDSYNLAFHSNDTHHFVKVIPRKPNSIFYLGYGLKQSPDNTQDVAKEIYNLFQKKN